MIIDAFVQVLLPVLIVVLSGYALRRAFPLDARTLNRLSLYVLTPVLVFVGLLRTEVVGGQALRLAAQMALVMICTLAISFGASHLLRLTRPQRSGFLLTTTFMNSGNYGLSVTRFAFGELGFQFAVIGYLTQAIFSQTVAVYLASAGSRGRLAALAQVFRVPLIYAVLAAVTLRILGIRLDESNGELAVAVYGGLRLIADAALPVLLIILGTQLTARERIGAAGPLSAAVIIRLLISIPLGYTFGRLLGLEGLPLYVGTLQTAMPTAVNMVVIALEFDAWPEFVSNGVLLTTLGSLITLALLLTAFGGPT